MARVLVVDDELGYRVSLEFFLNQAGHEVIAVGTTAAARAGRGLPTGSGRRGLAVGRQANRRDLAAALSAQNPRLKIILMTGLGPQMVRPQLESLQIFRMVEKPFEPSEIIDAVREAAAGLDSTQGSVGS